MNFQLVESWLSYNGLFSDIDQEEVYPKELAQFFANMRYEKEGTPHIESIINRKFITLDGRALEAWVYLPNRGIILQNYKTLMDLLFEYSHELLWTKLTHKFDPNFTKKLLLSQLTAEASMAFKIVSTNIYPQARNRNEPSLMMVVALYCLICKIYGNWASLSIYNMETCVKK